MSTEPGSTQVPPRYAHDPRVTARPGGGFDVRRSDETFHILHTEVFLWTICYGSNLDFLPVAGGGFAINIDTAAHAIEALIGDPIEVAA